MLHRELSFLTAVLVALFLPYRPPCIHVATCNQSLPYQQTQPRNRQQEIPRPPAVTVFRLLPRRAPRWPPPGALRRVLAGRHVCPRKTCVGCRQLCHPFHRKMALGKTTRFRANRMPLRQVASLANEISSSTLHRIADRILSKKAHCVSGRSFCLSYRTSVAVASLPKHAPRAVSPADTLQLPTGGIPSPSRPVVPPIRRPRSLGMPYRRLARGPTRGESTKTEQVMMALRFALQVTSRPQAQRMRCQC
jgi:hypothetical protein